MKKRILMLLIVVLLGSFLFHPICADAVVPLDPDADASLTLLYQKDGKAFPDLTIRIYRVAEAFPDGTFQLIPPFSSYPLNIQGITSQTQWNHIASTLNSYITAEQVQPHREMQTDADGIALFDELETGLYFVREVVAEISDGTYIFNQFMIYVPTPQSNGSYDYTVEAKPKCTGFVPKTQYTVTKLWQDTGNQELRPGEIVVDIYKDEVLQETQILNAGNNWSYTWYVSGEDHGVWTVAERSVPDSYKVTIQQNGASFFIVNTWENTPDIPETGDYAAPLLWIATMCVSGMMLVALGIYRRRCR